MTKMIRLTDYKKNLVLPLRQATLCFLIRENQILLAMKKRGFGVGKWNGVGGKVGSEENVQVAAIREAQEEIGVTPKDLNHVATLNFYNPYKPEWNQQVIVYFSDSWDGEPQESEEMKPQWFAKDGLPFPDMWPDDKVWLPKVLNGKKVQGDFMFGEDNSIVDFKID